MLHVGDLEVNKTRKFLVSWNLHARAVGHTDNTELYKAINKKPCGILNYKMKSAME